MVNLTGMLPPALGGKQETPPSYEPEMDLNKTQQFAGTIKGELGLSEDLMEEVEDYVKNPPKRTKFDSPIDAAIDAGYLIAKKISKDKTKYMSGLAEYTPEGNKAIRGMFTNALGADPDWNPTDVAWCATFVSQVLSELGADPLRSKDRYDRVRADKYRNYGSPVEMNNITEGDIVVLDFDGDGRGDHATFYVGDKDDINNNPDSPYISVLGGNQGDAVNIRQYGKENILAVRRITYDDIDYEFTKELARDNADFNAFLKKEGEGFDMKSLEETPMSPSNTPMTSRPEGFDEGGLAENDNLDLARSYGVTVVDPEETVQAAKDVGQFALESLPGVGAAFTAAEIEDELKKEDPNYLKIGMLVGTEAIGLIPGLGTAAKNMIRKGADMARQTDEVMDVASNIPKVLRKSTPSYTDAELLEADEIISEWGKGNLTNPELRSKLRDKGFNVETKRISPKMTGDDLEFVDPDGNIVRWKDMPRGKVDRGADAAEAARLRNDPDALEQWRKKNKLPETQRQKNIPEAQAAAQALIEGSITSREARKRIQEAFPEPREYTAEEVMKLLPTLTEVQGSLGKKGTRRPILGVEGADLKEGQVVSSRLDIPAYDDYNKWVVSIHDGNQKAGTVVGYGQAIRLKNIRFGSDADTALDIARGTRTDRETLQDAIDKKTGGPAKQNKATIARIFGEYTSEDPYELQRRAAEIIASGSDEWVQVGMNPYRKSAFYNKKTGMPVFEADEIIQVGPLVLAKNVKKPTISQMKEMAVRTKDGKIRLFNEGGTVMNEQMEMAFMQEGGIKDDGMKVDPVSGNEIPPGSMASEVRDDIPAMLSEGEYVIPADVLRYYGVNFFENLRGQAKQGLQSMEADGRIGGEPLTPNQVQQNMSGQPMAGAPAIQPIAANTGPMITGQPQGFQQAQGAAQSGFNPFSFSTVGATQFGTPASSQPTSVTISKTFVNSETGQKRPVKFVNGQVTPPSDMIYTQPPYYELGSPALKAAQDAVKQQQQPTGGGDDTDPPKPTVKDPNEWAKEITDPESWADEALTGKATTLIGTVKLATNVARVNAMAEVAKAQGNTDLYNSLKGKADEFVKNNPVLNSLPNAWIDGDRIAADLQKDKDMAKNLFGMKTEEQKQFGLKAEQEKRRQRAQAAAQAKADKEAEAAALKAAQSSNNDDGDFNVTNVEIDRDPMGLATMSTTYGSGEDATTVSATADEVDPNDPTGYTADVYRGGLMARKKSKKKK
jgi:hypothetical protein